MKRDYCTLAPEKVFSHEVWQCCKQHDLDYAMGRKIKGDFRFFNCVRKSAGLFTALVYFGAVATAGWFFYRGPKKMKKVQQSIVTHEGFKSKPYPDPIHGWDVPTFGHGLTYITEKESAEIVHNRIIKIDTALRGEIPFYKRLPVEAQHVLIEMAYQMGVNGLLEFEKTLEYLENQHFIAASAEMLDSLWASKQTSDRAKKLAGIIHDL